ncbi:MAG: DASS family sodium-coupled anion symporter [Negativicutes bacterium]|nr:DASS family sodium-coupled anion symporter [Negativicutes bacterium]
MNNSVVRGLGVVALCAVIWFIPVPTGLKPEAWHLFAIFVATIVGFIVKPLPIGAVALISITFAAFVNVLKPAEALSGFSNTTIWLIVAAFVFSVAFKKTGLGRRVAYTVMRAIGGSALRLGYAVVIADLIISPATASNAARAGGIMFPIVRSLASAFGSEPGPTARKIGAYLLKVSYQGDGICSSMFMTASAANTLAAALAINTLHANITWGLWALGAVVPGIVSLLVIPYFIYRVYPPELKDTPEAKQIAADELKKMGSMSRGEKITTAVFLGMLALWSTSTINKIDPAIVALAGVSVTIIFGVVDWKDVLKEEHSWDTMIWMGSLLSLADHLSKLGFIPWFAKAVAASLVGVPWTTAFVVLVLVYLYAHYGFASVAAHVTAMFVAFATVAVAAGAPLMLTVLILAYASHLGMSLTHYAAGPAPIYFGAGYIEQGTWWKIGFMISLINLVIWLGLGSIWWKILGLW